ncbi:alpha-N-acetylglucosaminidase [Promicromonospora umidemergens]|uniref:Alpha-N-acetylglucosaminidase n=1 Tax=Promicromonospora umidemergens TaxID=629679 RepID=A0ABP8XPA4_9MICO|nr:alpha-N-acetylglucosaminidase TIM-barrel domain-containing protein [Promicromonospora umidemergens]MCP2281985.1 alpha-N-acetylglucosaminidase [Promicromonospora umidemergens]
MSGPGGGPAPGPASEPAPAPWADAVGGVAGRAGLDRRLVTVERLPTGRPGAAPHCTADYRAEAGWLTVRGTSAVAASVALARYVRRYLGTRLTWQRPHVSRSSLPDAPRTTLSSPHEVRYYLNVVTFGYSTPFWGWDRWEREIDWMALHGVTHPLMLVAHEAVLAETFRRAGLPDAETAGWLGGAAHLPWTFMGGMHSFGGPLPARWAERRVDLARRVLGRMRELGMTPVLPAFGGHVPPALVLAAPDGEHPTGEHPAGEHPPGEIEWQGWRTPVLHPGSRRFQELFATFAQVQHELLGQGSGYFAVDPYIESVPPSGDIEYLRAAGRGTYRALASADPDAVWVLQGWPFHYQGAFWTPDRVAAYLRDVPADRTLVLDLWGEHAPLHTALLADGAPLAGRPWVWCALHNFGGRPALFGDLRGLVRDVRALHDGVPHLRGVGLAPEAIENNEVFYELATDLAWDDAPRSPADLDAWLDRFVLDRYGLSRSGPSGQGDADAQGDADRRGEDGGGPDGVPSGLAGGHISDPAGLALRAWHTITSTVYGAGRTRSIPTPVIARPWAAALPFPAQRAAGEAVDDAPPTPSSDVDAENDPAADAALPRLAEAVRDLTETLDTMPGTAPGHARDVLAADVAELAGHVLAQGTRVHVRGILAAARSGDPDSVRAHMGRLRTDLLALDDLAGARPETRVATWVDAARAWGDTDLERDAMEREARSLVSVWGEQHNGLHDYSGRHWQGLVRDLYLPRWHAWADWLADAAASGPVPPDANPSALRERIVSIEEAWRGGVRPGTE